MLFDKGVHKGGPKEWNTLLEPKVGKFFETVFFNETNCFLPETTVDSILI